MYTWISWRRGFAPSPRAWSSMCGRVSAAAGLRGAAERGEGARERAAAAGRSAAAGGCAACLPACLPACPTTHPPPPRPPAHAAGAMARVDAELPPHGSLGPLFLAFGLITPEELRMGAGEVGGEGERLHGGARGEGGRVGQRGAPNPPPPPHTRCTPPSPPPHTHRRRRRPRPCRLAARDSGGGGCFIRGTRRAQASNPPAAHCC